MSCKLGLLGHLGANLDGNGHLTCAVPTTSVQFIAYFTLAAEQTRKVVTCPKDTDVGKGALINILRKEK
jgi:hypothetical protein